MRGQHARRAGGRCLAGLTHAIEDAPERVRRTGDGCRTETGDAVSRQLLRDGCDGIPIVERIDSVDAVHVHVDEAWNDVVTVERKQRMRAGRRRISSNLRDPLTIDHERAGRQNAIGQHECRTGENDHRVTRLRVPNRS
jgi:hypothetical protein